MTPILIFLIIYLAGVIVAYPMALGFFTFLYWDFEVPPTNLRLAAFLKSLISWPVVLAIFLFWLSEKWSEDYLLRLPLKLFRFHIRDAWGYHYATLIKGELIEAPRLVFFCGNVLEGTERGIRLKQYETLRNRHGLIEQCKFIRLETATSWESRQFLPPVIGDEWQPHPTEKHLVGKPRYAADDVKRMIVPENPPENYGVRGIIEIEPMRGCENGTVVMANMVFFPNGEKFDTLRELESHIANTIVNLPNNISLSRRVFYRQIGIELLRSCDEYRAWGLEYVKSIAAKQISIKDAEYQYDKRLAERNWTLDRSVPLAEMVAKQLS